MQIQISFPSKRKQLAGVVAIFLALSVAAACRRPAKPVKVGFIGNLTGSFSDWGIASRNGFLLAVEQINSAGGIDGRQVEVVVRNDDFSHELAAKAVEELADMGVVAIVGPTVSESALHALEIANQRKLLLISPSASTAALSGRDDAFVRVCQADDLYFRLLTGYLFNRRGMRKLRIAHDLRNKAYSQNGAMVFKTLFEALGGQVEVGATIDDNTDFSKLAEEMTAAPVPDGLFILAGAIETAVACQHVRKRDGDLPIVVNAAEPSLIHYGGAGVEGVIGMYTGTVGNKEKSEDLQFWKQYDERFGGRELYNRGAVYGYDAVLVLRRALEAAPPWTLERLKQTIVAQKRFSGASGDFEIDAFGDSRRNARVITIRNGRIVELEQQ